MKFKEKDTLCVFNGLFAPLRSKFKISGIANTAVVIRLVDMNYAGTAQ